MQTTQFNKKFPRRKGLEGPYTFANGRILYYDALMGEYYDSTTDLFVPYDEMILLHQELMDRLKS